MNPRQRVESALPKDHGDHIAERGFNSLSQNNLVLKVFVPMPQVMKIPVAKAAGDKKWGEARKVASVAMDQGEEQKGGYYGAQSDKKEGPLWNVQKSAYVFHDTSGLSHGHPLAGFFWEDSLRKFYWDRGNACLFIEKQKSILISVRG